ncbi:FAD-dependent oxidoreductase [Sulfitobacter sp. F26169L]|uniref:FAD-dependent oxidoreductase n=1 Tax=Sulfitobacter sp. F26169L TaxID=2996015 RepID=UPI002B1F3DAD|nr:FAD-dependent oxidoreductase [Sulfitobacter sp. F26169L]
MMLDRRRFLSLAALSGAGALATRKAAQSAPTPVKTSASIVIVGAGAAGAALANQLARRLLGAKITLIDPRHNHLYQPGPSLVAAGAETCGLRCVKNYRLAAQGCNPYPRCCCCAGPRNPNGIDRRRADPQL